MERILSITGIYIGAVVLTLVLCAAFALAGFWLGRRRFLSPQCLTCDGATHKQSFAMQSVEQGVVLVNIKDSQHPIVYVNQAFLNLSAYKLKDVMGRPFTFLTGKQTDNNALERLAALSSPAKEEAVEMECYRKDGSSFWGRVKKKPVFGKAWVAYLIDDISSQKEVEWGAFQAQKLESLGMLAGGVAHDFNNILSVIEGYAYLLKTKYKRGGYKQENEKIQAIIDTAERGALLTRKLLAFGKQSISFNNTCDLAKSLYDDSIFKPLIGENIQLSYQMQEDEILVQSDHDVIWQIMINLLSNARDAMDSVGKIEILAGVVDPLNKPPILESDKNNLEFAYLTVADTGKGMSDVVKKRVFEPFFTTKETGKGTGIGLSVVYGLVKQMKGHITIDSAEGQGTAITVYIPLVKNTDAAKDVNEVVYNGEDDLAHLLAGKTALVVDDEPAIVHVLKEALEEWNMRVLCADDGDKALLIEDDHKEVTIDFLLTDVAMPGLDGYRLAEIFEEIRPECSVVLMSGYRQKHASKNGDEEGKRLLLEKPVHIEDLRKTMALMLEQSEKLKLRHRWTVKGNSTVTKQNQGKA